MKLFEFTPEVTRLLETSIAGIFVVLVVVAAIWSFMKWKEMEAELKEIEKLSSQLSDDLFDMTRDYSKVCDNNTSLIKRIKDLEAKIARTDQPRVSGRFSVKKVNGVSSNVGKYECISNALVEFDKGKLYERYANDTTGDLLILTGNDRMRHNMTKHRRWFNLVEA